MAVPSELTVQSVTFQPCHLNSRTVAIATTVKIMKLSYLLRFFPLLSHLLFFLVTSARTEFTVKLTPMHRRYNVTWQHCWINLQQCSFSVCFSCVVSVSPWVVGTVFELMHWSASLKAMFHRVKMIPLGETCPLISEFPCSFWILQNVATALWKMEKNVTVGQ